LLAKLRAVCQNGIADNVGGQYRENVFEDVQDLEDFLLLGARPVDVLAEFEREALQQWACSGRMPGR
jgi:hypothetical protein